MPTLSYNSSSSSSWSEILKNFTNKIVFQNCFTINCCNKKYTNSENIIFLKQVIGKHQNMSKHLKKNSNYCETLVTKNLQVLKMC